MATYYIGADVHVNNTELAVEYRCKIVQRYSVPTSIPAIGAVLGSLQGKKFLAMEEGPMAGWLYRNLSQDVDKFIVCEPRRNKLITSEGDTDAVNIVLHFGNLDLFKEIHTPHCFLPLGVQQIQAMA